MVAENEEERAKLRERKRKQKKEREAYSKIMGLEYFLEMVDHKHRYGSNLRRYHAEWKKADTNENYFYWLDYGEGKDLDLEDRPRSRLDTECVRYLSREERLKYLVKIDKEGRFCWAKNDQPVTTSIEFKDSIDGIVPTDDDTPTWREVTTGVAPQPSPDGSSSSGLSSSGDEDNSKYVNTELHDAKGLAKVQHLNVDTLMNQCVESRIWPRGVHNTKTFLACCARQRRRTLGSSSQIRASAYTSVSSSLARSSIHHSCVEAVCQLLVRIPTGKCLRTYTDQSQA